LSSTDSTRYCGNYPTRGFERCVTTQYFDKRSCARRSDRRMARRFSERTILQYVMENHFAYIALDMHMLVHDSLQNHREIGFGRNLIAHSYGESAGRSDIASLMAERACRILRAIRRIARSHSPRYAGRRLLRALYCVLSRVSVCAQLSGRGSTRSGGAALAIETGAKIQIGPTD
jgi:hypothetical protein